VNTDAKVIVKLILTAVILCTLLFCSINKLAALVQAHKEQDTLPINIQSDSANFDEKTGIATHLGNVSVNQGDRLLSADTLEIHRNKEGKISFITAKGSPASFEANPEPNKPKIYGKANILKYLPKENKIILMDAAELKQEDKLLQGAQITYQFDNQMLTSDSVDNQRTTVILQQGQ
jgi:lipopolysaccharide export system protein LptA